MASLSHPRPIIVASQPLDAPRTGSILLNPDGGPVVADNSRRRSWNGTGPVAAAAAAIFTTTTTDGPQAAAAPSGIECGQPPVAITVSRTASSRSPTDGSTNGGLTTDGSAAPTTAASPRIRFAPLPDPHSKPRSLSTGHNVGLVAGEGPDGERKYSVELNYDEHALDDEEDDDSADDSGDSGRRRSWMGMGSMGMGSMGMGSMTKATKSSWKGTKKLLGKPTKESSGDEMGVPLKKSVSASGLMGTSPFRLAEPEKKKNLLSTSPSSSLFAAAMGGRRPSASVPMPTHTRGGSGDAGTPKVRMLNGRVYGARRASEAAAAEEMRRQRMEPEFVEWGSGHGAAPAASAQSASVGSRTRYSNPEDDDGGGMAWVRKRREERERKEREEKERRESAAADESDAAAAAPTATAAPIVTDDSQQLQASPSERPASLSSSTSSSPAPVNGLLTPHEPPHDLGQFPPTVLVSAPGSAAPMPRHPQPTPKGENDHVVRAVAMPASEKHMFVSEADGQDGHDVDSPAEEEDEEEEEDDGDWDCDDEEEEEEDVGVNRFTCSAAGVEVVSRHRQAA